MKHTKWPSALAYDETHIYVKRGEQLWRENVLMLINVVTTWYEANVKDEIKSQISLSKCYQNVLTYESVKLMKKPVSMNTLMKVLRIMYTEY